jgi:hypothetical protein
MRLRLAFLIVAAVVVLVAGASDAACRAAGEYRVSGPDSAGFATLVERSSSAPSPTST